MTTLPVTRDQAALEADPVGPADGLANAYTSQFVHLQAVALEHEILP
ncbi:MAG TPA: hypothetical protein VMR97_02730 [Acidimicrobiales bacterium]|nr:hypothetical protein [Acidimicrobiales bacterium]